MPTDIFNAVMESAAEFPGGPSDNLMVFAKTSPVPRNSGAQVVLPKIIKTLNRAKRFRPPVRDHMIAMAKEDLIGYATIGSENGFILRELNTQRVSTQNMGINEGPAMSPWDDYLYGQKYTKNNPKGGDDFLDCY